MELPMVCTGTYVLQWWLHFNVPYSLHWSLCSCDKCAIPFPPGSMSHTLPVRAALCHNCSSTSPWEPITQLNQQSGSLASVMVHNSPHYILLYEDDNLIYTSNPSESIPFLLNIFKQFGKYFLLQGELVQISSDTIKWIYRSSDPSKLSYCSQF